MFMEYFVVRTDSPLWILSKNIVSFTLDTYGFVSTIKSYMWVSNFSTRHILIIWLLNLAHSRTSSSVVYSVLASANCQMVLMLSAVAHVFPAGNSSLCYFSNSASRNFWHSSASSASSLCSSAICLSLAMSNVFFCFPLLAQILSSLCNQCTVSLIISLILLSPIITRQNW